MPVDNPDDPQTVETVEVETHRRRGGLMDSLPYGDVMSQRESKISEPISAKQAADRWKNRRRMAYIALAAMIAAFAALMFFVSTDRLEQLQEPAGWFFISMASIVGAYCGFATMDDKWRGGGSRGRYND